MDPSIDVPGFASDLSREKRPGVPRERPPRPDVGAHWGVPARQVAGEELLEREGLGRVTPVYGTAQPVSGLSGWLRRRAYAISELKTRHWMLLLLADRIEAFGYRARQRARQLPLLAVAAASTALGIRDARRPRSPAAWRRFAGRRPYVRVH